MLHYFAIHKPFQVLSQFSPEAGKQTLSDFFSVPRDVYPVGRLDYDSEGLLLLSNDKQLNHRLLDPRFAHEREYWVQVEGAITEEALQQLASGVNIHINGKTHHTLPAKATLLSTPPPVNERTPPIRFRKHIPVSWISLVLTEGKNRQVRRMTAATGFPTLRLVRYRIADLTLQHLPPGHMRSLNKKDIYHYLAIN